MNGKLIGDEFLEDLLGKLACLFVRPAWVSSVTQGAVFWLFAPQGGVRPGVGQRKLTDFILTRLSAALRAEKMGRAASHKHYCYTYNSY